MDVLLHRLCITRSRSEAKSACDSGAVTVNGAPARASQEVAVGDLVGIRFSATPLEIRLEAMPPKSTSRKAAKEMYSVVGGPR